jgi:hypothetical protein
MVSLTQLWLPILLSAVFVFIASSIINMVLSFWHRADYHGFSNEDEVRAALRKGMTEGGMYNVPFCVPEKMNDPEMLKKMEEGPLAMVALKPGAKFNLGVPLLQWFVFCLLVSLVAAMLALVLPVGAPSSHVFHTLGLAGLLGHAMGPIPNGIWWAHSWRSVFKYVVDGVVYAVIIGATFMWLWPK